MLFSKLGQKFKRQLILRQRFLTDGEKNMARSVFAESLKLEGIRVVAHRLILPNYAMSPNGHIYFNLKNWSDDFSKEGLGTQSWLIHELTHVWQIQQGISVIRKAMLNRRYRYVFEHGKQFLSYGVEQQAQMVQDYYIRRAQDLDCSAYDACLPFLETSTIKVS